MVFRTMTLDCAGVGSPDARLIDRIARLRLTAARHGVRLLLANVNQALNGLIDFCGLAEVLGIEPRRQPEQREQPCGVEEESHLGDPAL